MHASVICVCGAIYSWCIEMVRAPKWMCVGEFGNGVCGCMYVCVCVCV